ncbi:MAG: hypothetical protein ACOYKJ_08730 [Candidatus Howiella sp.]
MFGTRAEASAEGAKEAVYSAVFSISREAAALSTTSAGENVNTSGRVDSASRSLYNNTSRKNAGIQPLRNAQATVVSTGERVKLSDAPIHAVEDGQVILNTSSGRMPLSSVRFENPQVPMIYAMAVDGYGAKTANLYINGYDRAVAYNPNMDIETYTYAFENIARKSAEVGSESRVRSELPGELSEIGEAAFLYAYGAGPAFKNAKERGKYGGEEARNGQNNGDYTGSLRPSGGLEAGADVGGRTQSTYESTSGIQRAIQQNDTRGKRKRDRQISRRVNGGQYIYAETAEEAKSERSKALQSEFAELGIESTVIDGKAEVARGGRKTVLGGEATTIADGSVLVRNDGKSAAPTRRISGHEFFHAATKRMVSKPFVDATTGENINFQSKRLQNVSDQIRIVYGENFNIIENPRKFYNEFCAFVSGDIYENGGSLSAEFASMFHDPAAVEAAWADMRARFVPSERSIYTSAIHKAEEAGKQGFSWDYTAQKYAPYIEEIGQQAFQDAYNAGRANLSHGKRAAAKTGTAVREKAAGLTASKEKRFAQKIVRKIGKATGVHFQVVDSLPQKDGKATYGKMEYDEKGNPIITISMESPNLISTAFHELTHWMKDAAPNEWERYAGYVMNWIEDRDGRTAEALIDSYMERYGFAQDEEGRAAAMEEIVCDASEAMLDDKTAVLDFANRNKGIAKKIADFFSDLFETIRSYLAEHGKATAIGRALSEQETLVRDMRDLWVQAYDAAVKNAGKSKPAAGNGGAKNSIEALPDGRKYVKANRQVIFGTDATVWRRQIYNYINRTIRQGKDVTVYGIDGDPLTITKDTAGKARFRNYVRRSDGSKRLMTDEEYAVKLRAESHIDELAEVSRRGKNMVSDTKNHSFAKDGFNYRTAYFQDFDGSYYHITMSVGKNGLINTVYNVGKIKETERPLVAQRPARVITTEDELGSVSNNRIAENNSAVNSQYMQKSGSDTEFADSKKMIEDTSGVDLSKLLEKYGALPRGEKAEVDVRVPAKTSDNKNVMRFTRTLLESGVVTDDMADTVKQGILDEALSYTPSGDQNAIRYANSMIYRRGMEAAQERWAAAVYGKGIPTKEEIAIGERLLQIAAESRDKTALMKYTAEVAEIGTRAGQAVQAKFIIF